MPSGKAKVTISLVVNAIVEVTDDGYLGIQETVAKHIAKAENEARAWQWFVQKGGLEPEQIQARAKVNSVTIVPKEN